MFKHLVGHGHAEFSSGRQQDAAEYMQHLLEVILENTTYVVLRAGPPFHRPSFPSRFFGAHARPRAPLTTSVDPFMFIQLSRIASVWNSLGLLASTVPCTVPSLLCLPGQGLPHPATIDHRQSKGNANEHMSLHCHCVHPVLFSPPDRSIVCFSFPSRLVTLVLPI